MEPSLPLLNARIKLWRQHLWQWDTLALTQKKVWLFITEETAQGLTFYKDNKLAYPNLESRQSIRLIKIMESQRVEREQMKTRHSQELALLEQVIKTPE